MQLAEHRTVRRLPGPRVLQLLQRVIYAVDRLVSPTVLIMPPPLIGRGIKR